MITSIRIQNFKKFEEAKIDIGPDPILFVGQNNGGKTTALQALSLWSFFINRWQAEKTGSKATKRTGLPISRNTIAAVPVSDTKLLWTSGDVQDAASQKIKIVITVSGQDEKGADWEYGIEATFSNKEQLYCKPLIAEKEPPIEAKKVFHLPPLSGVQTVEKKWDEAAQMQAIGEGRPGEILRNLLLRVQNNYPEKWTDLKAKMKNLFNIELLDIAYNPSVDPAIVVNYREVFPRNQKKSKIDFEIANAGSGFLQFILLAAFMYAHENGAVLLIDEPDSHMHAFLQGGMYDWLLELANETQSQLIISTHSEVLVNKVEDVSYIRTFFGSQPKKIEIEKNQLQKVLREVSPFSVINAEMSKKIFFAEGDTDLRILKAFAKTLEHSVLKELESPSLFFRPYKTNDIGESMGYFKALKNIVQPELTAFCLRDFIQEANRTQTPPADFRVEYWQRKEIENYLLYPAVLLRFLEKRGFRGLFQEGAQKYLQGELPPNFYNNPLGEDIGEKGSDFLEKFFSKIQLNIRKGSYWEIATEFQKTEIHEDVKNMLNKINSYLAF